MSARLSLLSLLAALALPAPAHAYLDAASFEADPTTGGGGGRFFTGSPRDGYGCAVCHRGGTAPVPEILGLPADGIVPGTRYVIELRYADTLDQLSAIAEIATESGEPAGTLVPLSSAEITMDERCADGDPALELVVSGDRTLARIDPCGATRARFAWTAPDTAAPLRLHLSSVNGDRSGTTLGDGASTVLRPLSALGAPPSAAGTLAQRCAAAPGARSAALPLASLFALALFLARRAARA